MNEYNDKWTKEKFLEYRKLKRSGYTHKMLIEHFGEDIYYSNLYNRNGSTLPHVLKYVNFISEIKTHPEETRYGISPIISNINSDKLDYIITFVSNSISYTICLMYFKIHNEETYNIIFTTEEQWREYQSHFLKFSEKGYITSDEFKILDVIIGRETKLNDLFPIFRKISWILLDFYNKHINGQILSIGETDNKKKIKLYRNIIKDSFPKINEKEVLFDGNRYYIYKINEI
jgi:hypothetical protein